MLEEVTIFKLILETLPFIMDNLGVEEELIEIFSPSFLENDVVRNFIIKQIKNKIKSI